MTQEDVDLLQDKEKLTLIRQKLGNLSTDQLRDFLATIPEPKAKEPVAEPAEEPTTPEEPKEGSTEETKEPETPAGE